MTGFLEGHEKRSLITNISASMTKDFCTIMDKILIEANAGAFSTKGDAVRRRDELLELLNDLAETAEPAAVAPAASAEQPQLQATPAHAATDESAV